jgi:hypothetical protein
MKNARTRRRAWRRLYEAIRGFTGPLDKLHADTKIAPLIAPRKLVRRKSVQVKNG